MCVCATVVGLEVSCTSKQIIALYDCPFPFPFSVIQDYLDDQSLCRTLVAQRCCLQGLANFIAAILIDRLTGDGDEGYTVFVKRATRALAFFWAEGRWACHHGG